ncbi:hypothetical protein QBC45DRAFT_65831 [Copromyces sp. CBS 386.78]|nr:hypothetical protein QBC45DRAFT_65831 [Copromyces sp. CBS 386.78]
MSGCPRLPPKSRCKNQPAAAPFFVMKKEGRFPRPFNQPPIVKYQAKASPPPLSHKTPSSFPIQTKCTAHHAQLDTHFPTPIARVCEYLLSSANTSNFTSTPAHLAFDLLAFACLYPSGTAIGPHATGQPRCPPRCCHPKRSWRTLVALRVGAQHSRHQLESLRVAVSTQSFHRTCHLRSTPGAHFALPTHVSGLASRKHHNVPRLLTRVAQSLNSSITTH